MAGKLATWRMCACIALAGIAVSLAVTNMIRLDKGSEVHTTSLKKLPETMSTPQDVVNLFTLDTATIAENTTALIHEIEERLQALLAIPETEKTFENTMRAFDTMSARLSTWGAILHTLTMVSPDEAIRTAAQKAVLALEEFSIEHLSHNKALYNAFKAYYAHNFPQESLTDEQRYYVTEALKDMKRSGLELPDAAQEQLKVIQKELADLSLAFQTTINMDQRSITVPRSDLAGLSDEFIATLPRDYELYILGTDTPTVTQVMEHCSVGETRKALSRAYVHRGHPENSERLQKIIQLRDELAQLLGYVSYAQLEIENSMAKSVPAVEAFLADLAQRVEKKVAIEMIELQVDLPEGVTVTEEGPDSAYPGLPARQATTGKKFYPWDLGYVKACYKKKHMQLDEREIAKYFPVEKTVPALLKIYSEFFGMQFVEIPVSGLWHPDVRMIRAEQKGRFIGYLLLDLYPRPHKYTHACEIPIYKARKSAPAVAVVLANFPKPTADAPGLLKHNDVSTFFHEFGHAVHDLLSNTDMVGFAGTSVKLDFVEMPSQMLEEWIWDAEMLKRVSSHYQTGEPLSDELIDRLRAVKDFCTGDFVQRQLAFAQLSLACFMPGAQKDPYTLKQAINQKIRPYIVSVPEDRFEASFGHLTGYGARYYGYLWSKVFALDMFEHIKQHGLVNAEIGCKYADEILGKGGSIDPEILLVNFLGREPRSDAFFKDLGL